jgi:uncharacterized OB-fold protein
MGKRCPECGDSFIGLEQVCPVCRRQPRKAVTFKDRPLKAELVAGEPCPMCGKKYRPRVSDAERQRRYRERKKNA